MYSLATTVAIASEVKKDSEKINGTRVARVMLDASIDKPMVAEIG